MTGPVADLEAAEADYREVREEIERIGEDRVERVAETYREFADLLDAYEGRATGSGGEVFEAYVEFEGELAALEEDLSDDLLEREAFEEAADALDRRRLAERDFERARELLSPAADVAALLDERARARERHREARDRIERRIAELDGRIRELDSLLAFADADFDAPVSAIREPVEAYDGAVAEAFADFKADASAREVVEFVDATDAYPLVPFRSPPGELRSYLREHGTGEEPIPTLIEYADYSFSKLEHYVDDPGEFKGVVGANRTYLERLDAGPLTVGWPPPPAERLRFRVRELVAVVGRFAPDDVIRRLHDVRALSRRADYERVRETARADDELDAAERERLRSGAAERERDRLRGKREEFAATLEEYPER